MNKRKLLVSIVAGILAAVMLLGMVLSLIPTTASAASSSEIKKQLDTLKEDKAKVLAQMEEVQSQYEANEDEITDLVNQKAKIDQEVFLLSEQIAIVEEEISAYSLLIADKQDELDDAETRLAELNQKNTERIRSMEEDGAISYWSVLFKASSFSDLLDRMNMIEEIAASDQRRLEEISEAAETVADAKEELAAEKDELEVSKAEQAEAMDNLEIKQEEAEELLAELIEKSDELAELYEGFELEEEALMDEIAAKEKEYDRAKYAEYMATYVPPTTKPPATTQPTTSNGSSSTTGTTTGSSGNKAPTSSGSWSRPLSGYRISSPFGYRNSPTAGASTYHKGIDLAASQGTPIYAARSGVVTAATYSNSSGYYVSINHGDGYASVYMHMTRYVVSAGQAVSQGQLIGYVGSTGISTGPHLHFGISYNGSYVNPANYINF